MPNAGEELEHRIDALAEALRRPLTTPSGLGAVLDVTRVTVDVRPAQITLHVRIQRQGSGEVEEWQVNVPTDSAVLRELRVADIESLRLIFRANLEEWWHVRHAEPDVAAWGRRVG